VRNLLYVLLTLVVLTAGGVASETVAVMEGPASAGAGDTLLIGDTLVHLAGIDAPESDQTCTRDGETWHCGEAATEALAALVASGPVVCRDVVALSDGVARGHCVSGDVDLAERILAEGLAVVDGATDPAYGAAEAAARDAGIGLWAGEFMVPSRWREVAGCSCSARKKAYLEGFLSRKQADEAVTAN